MATVIAKMKNNMDNPFLLKYRERKVAKANAVVECPEGNELKAYTSTPSTK